MTNSSLTSIGVRVETPLLTTGNVLPVLHEVLHALLGLAVAQAQGLDGAFLLRVDEGGEFLVVRGESLTIGLRAIPFGPGDEERLLETLGEGEIRAAIDSLGRTDVWETRYPGVWIVDHRNTEGVRIGLQVEITDVPALIRTPGDDIRDAVAELEEMLAAAGTMPSQEGTT